MPPCYPLKYIHCSSPTTLYICDSQEHSQRKLSPQYGQNASAPELQMQVPGAATVITVISMMVSYWWSDRYIPIYGSKHQSSAYSPSYERFQLRWFHNYGTYSGLFFIGNWISVSSQTRLSMIVSSKSLPDDNKSKFPDKWTGRHTKNRPQKENIKDDKNNKQAK